MASDIFTYGSLMLPEVMRIVTGRSFHPEAAVLRGYKRYLLMGQVYPGIVPEDKGEVHGSLYFGVDDAALERLDYFESDVYEREAVQVILADGHRVEAFAYVVAEPHRDLLSDQPWDEATFVERHLPGFMSRARGWMQELDEQP